MRGVGVTADGFPIEVFGARRRLGSVARAWIVKPSWSPAQRSPARSCHPRARRASSARRRLPRHSRSRPHRVTPRPTTRPTAGDGSRDGPGAQALATIYGDLDHRATSGLPGLDADDIRASREIAEQRAAAPVRILRAASATSPRRLARFPTTPPRARMGAYQPPRGIARRAGAIPSACSRRLHPSASFLCTRRAESSPPPRELARHERSLGRLETGGASR